MRCSYYGRLHPPYLTPLCLILLALPIHILEQASPHVTGNVSRQRGDLQLFVRNSANRIVTLDVPASASITSVLSKALIRFKGWAGQRRHDLFFGGTPLEPGRSLLDYTVFNYATLQLMSFLVGGMEAGSTSEVKSIPNQP